MFISYRDIIGQIQSLQAECCISVSLFKLYHKLSTIFSAFKNCSTDLHARFVDMKHVHSLHCRQRERER